MAEGRFISRSIATNGQLKRVSLEADFLFTKMIPHLDREGRIDGDPDVVKAMACPLRGELTSELIATCLSELDAVGLIEWYEVDIQKIIQFPGFKDHQRGMKPEREKPSRLMSRDSQGAKAVRRTPPVHVPEPSPDVGATLPPKLSEVKLSEVKSSKAKTAAVAEPGAVQEKYKALYASWAPLFGPMDYPRFCKAVKPIFQPGSPPFEVPDIQNGMVAAHDWWVEQEDRDQGFFSIEKFVSQLSAKWIPFGKMPNALHGELTERGAWAGSKAIREASRGRPRLTAS